MDKVTVIIPTLNEAEGIGPTIQEIIEELKTSEIIVIDAKSVDGTAQIAAHLGAKVITQLDRGKGNAIGQALKQVARDTKWLIIVDGDYTYRATYIPAMIALLKRKEDVGMVTGRRLGPKGQRFSLSRHSLRRPVHNLQHFLQHYGLRVLHLVLNKVRMEDPTTGLRVIRFECLKNFQPKAKGFDIEVEINWWIRRKGYDIVEFPINIRPRLGMDKLRYSKHGVTVLMRMVIIGVEDVVSRLKSFLKIHSEVKR